ncbi:WD-REPEATS-REGION domain-containing protein [Mycena indigotica]|uniref:WD-REPEATS-REGION domain-containing protein n=1 Tax=Mycena indigotica TaxID=2126181 RepID=A0A8H6WH66_9AGAR|nr:WD-REPEATS-REGION domain-containing protein [Mycena indigotica]KAF7312174.1 WD-REPEATS-REGION domain-containing protein [Mycena indigotica]
MALLDRITDGITRVLPKSESQRSKIPPAASLGIGNAGAGHAPFEDDMIVSKPMIVFHTSQAFFNFLAMCCFASVAAFQAKWNVGPSGLSGLAIFLSLTGIFLPLFMLLVPVAYERYDKVIRLARALKEVRVGFILTGTGTTFALLIAQVFIFSLSPLQDSLKLASRLPYLHSPNPAAKMQIKTRMQTKGMLSSRDYLAAFIFWAASLTLLVLDWRSGKLHSGPRDPPFTHPTQEATDYEMDYDPDDEEYQHIPPARRTAASDTYDNNSTPPNPFSDQNRYSAGRPSVDAYGAFSDPAPSGFSPAVQRFGSTPPVLPQQDLGPSIGVSRTMQYADPYAAVKQSIAGGGGNSSTPSQGYDGYQGYR